MHARIASGAYDWIIFPAALAFVALMVSGFWRDYGHTGRAWHRLVLMEQAAGSGAVRARLTACENEALALAPGN
jgi:hypothetical protein